MVLKDGLGVKEVIPVVSEPSPVTSISAKKIEAPKETWRMKLKRRLKWF